MGRYRRYTKNRFTDLGTPYTEMVNNTGANSVKGTLFRLSNTVENAFSIPSNPYDIAGVVYESGKANGAMTKVVLSGLVEVLIEDGTTAGFEGWMRASTDQLGRAINTTGPAGLGALSADEHFKEIGHCAGQVSVGGTDQLVKMILHFN